MRAVKLLDTVMQLKFSNQPFKLSFATTYQCNMKCKMCNVWNIYSENPRKRTEELSIDEVYAIFKGYNSFKWVNITGGEPFLRSDIGDLVHVICESSPRLRILNLTTNGCLPQRVEKVIEEVLKEFDIPHLFVSVSLDGSRDIHDYVRGKENSFTQAIDSLHRLNALSKEHSNLSVGIEYTISPFNKDGFKGLMNELNDNNLMDLIRNTTINFAQSGFLYHSNLAPMNDKERSSMIDEIKSIFKYVDGGSNFLTIFRSTYLKLLIRYLNNGSGQVIPCAAASSSYFLDPYGNIHPCITMNDVIGNLREQDYNLKRIVESERNRIIRDKIRMEKCPLCWTPCEAYPSMIASPFRSLSLAWMKS